MRGPRDATVDRPLEAEGRTSEIAYGGETAHQRAFGFGRGGEIDETDVGGQQFEHRQGGEHGVPVRVDQAGHQRAAAAVDDLRALGSGFADRFHGLDLVALYDNAPAFDQPAGLAVKYLDVCENHRASRRFGNCRRCFLGPQSRSANRRSAGKECAAGELLLDQGIEPKKCRTVADTTGQAGIVDMVGG